MKNVTNINCPVGSFEDIRDFDIAQFGNIDNPNSFITPEEETKMASLAEYRCENAERYISTGDYRVAIELLKSAQWLLSILARQKTEEQK